jgi:NADPH:quinone reductase
LTRPSASQPFGWDDTWGLFTPDDRYQGALLDRTAQPVDAGALVSTHAVTLHGLNAATLQEAHRRVEGSAAIGKVVVTT